MTSKADELNPKVQPKLSKASRLMIERLSEVKGTTPTDIARYAIDRFLAEHYDEELVLWTDHANA